MKAKKQFLGLILFLICVPSLQPLFARGNQGAAISRVRIGVDIQLGFESCIDTWSPVADYLSKALPEYHFIVVPLGSRQDIAHALQKGDVDFVVLDPAMEIVVNDLYGATPLLTMSEAEPNTTLSPPIDSISGTLIRLASRSDIADIHDLRGKRLAAVKPWSLNGWIAQWGLLEKNGLNPHKDLKQVVFVGTNGQVIENVLNGSADVGAVDAKMLDYLIRGKQVPEQSLYFINRQGLAVPVEQGEDMASTVSYPGRVLSKAKATSDKLAQRVAGALLRESVETSVDKVPCQISWTVASNYGRVRHLLYTLMGPQYAASPGFPLPRQYPPWVIHVIIIGSALASLIIAFFVLRNRYSRREGRLTRQVEDLQRELRESRAEQQRINAILALAGCGIDIVDDENQIVYADPGLEREYGDWHGKKCHEYFCSLGSPCHDCRRPGPDDEQRQTILDMDGLASIPGGDPHAKVHYINGQSTRMIGIPFRDEGGRWLYARIHFPLEAFAEKVNI